MLTKGAIGNLVNRYKAVLKKCNVINTFGSLAVASMLVMGGAGMAMAADDIIMTSTLQKVTTDADGNKTYGDFKAAGDIFVSSNAGQLIVIDEKDTSTTSDDIYSALDIEVANLTAGGTITAGEITTHGNLTADNVQTYRNSDPTLSNNAGSVTVNGAVNLPGDNMTQRRFDVYNQVGSHNVIGNLNTGACIGLAGNGLEKSTLTGGFLAVGGEELKLGGGSFTVVNGMQATIDKVSFKYVDGRKARVHNDADSKVATILDLNELTLWNGYIIADASWDSQYSLGVIRSISPDDTRPGVLIGDGHILVGANSMVSLGEGSTVDGIYDLMKTHTGYEAPTKDGVKAALVLTSPLEVQDSFKIFMDGELRTEALIPSYATTSDTTKPGAKSSLLEALDTAGTFTQGANTLLVVNGANDHVHYTTAAKAAVPGAISYANGSADALVEDGAKLAITGAQAGETYVILGKGFDDITFGQTAWTGDNLLSDNPLVSLTRSDDGTVAGEAVADGSSVRGQFGGLALGADLEAGQFLGGKFRVGAAINGGGQSETKGSATVTENDYDFGGINFYAGWNKDALNIIGSVGYAFGNHEVEMGLSSIGMGKAKSDIDTSAFTADLRAEYQLNTQYVDILPHVGVRYTALRTDSHDLKVNGSVLNSVDSETQHIVQFPIGVTLSKNVTFADWIVKPMVDVSIIPAVGDKDTDTKVKFSGLNDWSNVNSRIMDSTSWAGTVGIQAEKGNFTLGLNYGVQASSHETDQNVQFKLGWKF